MKCPKCGAENPEGSMFCQECGTKLTPETNLVAPSKEGHGNIKWIILAVLILIVAGIVLFRLFGPFASPSEGYYYDEAEVVEAEEVDDFDMALQLSESILGDYTYEANGFRKLKRPIELSKLYVTPSINCGLDSTIYYTEIQIRSKTNKNLRIDYGHFFPEGAISINDQLYYIGVREGWYVSYDLSQYGSDLYIWGYQYNYNLSGTYIY